MSAMTLTEWAQDILAMDKELERYVARMRVFSAQQVQEWLQEDRIDEQTRSVGKRLLADLRDASSTQ